MSRMFYFNFIQIGSGLTANSLIINRDSTKKPITLVPNKRRRSNDCTGKEKFQKIIIVGPKHVDLYL